MNDSTQESRRLEAVHALALLDTAPEPEYSELVELAAELCGTPMSAISLLDASRQWFKASLGLDAAEISRDLSVCQYTLQQDGLLVVEDLREDARFQSNEMVWSEQGLRFYAGLPLLAGDGQAVGTLCVVDRAPRHLTEVQRRGLEILARQVETNFRLRTKQRELEKLSLEKAALSSTLEKKNKLFLAFMDHGPFVSYIKDAEGRLRFYNEGLRRVFKVEGDSWLGKSDHDLWPREMADTFREHDLGVISGGVPVVIEEQSPGPEGTEIIWRSYKFPIVDEQGELALAGISVDITADKEQKVQLELSLCEQRKMTETVAHSQSMLRTLLENNPNQCYLKSEDGRYLFYNRRFADHFGISESKWLGKTDFEFVPRALAQTLRDHDLQALSSDTMLESQGEMNDRDGTPSTFRIMKFRCQDGDGVRMLAGIAIDISGEQKREREYRQTVLKLEEIASVDGLTGLANRRAFDLRLEEAFANAELTGQSLSLLLMDVDNFKQRNDRWGHAAGDLALKELGRELQSCARRGDLAARVGGEEFAVLMLDTRPEEAQVMAERVLACVRRLQIKPEPMTVSAGVASRDATTRSSSQLYSRADDAMYTAKRQGKDRVVLHSAHIQSLMRSVVEDLQRAEVGPAA